MTAACITYEEIESRTQATVALAIHARHIKESFFAHTVGYPLLFVLARKVGDLRSRLNTPFLEKCEDSQLIELADLLRQLNSRLVKLVADARQSALDRFAVLKKPLESIEESSEDLESIIENMYLAVNPDFHKVVSSAIAKLDIGVEERAALRR